MSFQGRRLTSITGEFSDIDIMLAQAAVAGVSHLLISPWILLVPVLAEPALAARICRVQNESLAEAAACRADGRVLALGAVPLQDPAACSGRARAPDDAAGPARRRGAGQRRGQLPRRGRFAPFWAAAADTGAVVFVHPTTTGLGLPALDDHYLWNSVGNPVETTIAAAQLVTDGVLARHPGLKILLAHGGGALLALRGRLRPRLRSPAGSTRRQRRSTRPSCCAGCTTTA